MTKYLFSHFFPLIIKENIITKLQKLYRPARKLKTSNKSPALFLKELPCTGNLLTVCKIFIERPASYLLQNLDQYYIYMLDIIDSKLYRPKTSNKKPPPKSICIIDFQNKAIQYIKNKITNLTL